VLGAGVLTQRRLAATLAGVPRAQATAARLAARSLVWSVRQEASLLARHAWPVAAVLAVVGGRPARRLLVAGLLVDAVVGGYELQRVPRPAWVLAHQLDNLAYDAGLWRGAIRARSPRCLVPRLARTRSTKSAAPR